MSKIPCLDLKKQYLQIKEEVLAATAEVFEQTAFSGGPFVEKFEMEFAQYCQTNYSMAVNNGTTALHLAMLALGIGPGDEVILPANTFIATAWGISYVGATPVFVDCLPDTWEIDPKAVAQAITSRTKAVAGVHLYGQPFDIEGVKNVIAGRDIFLVEDAAQAQGARYRGQRVGSFGEMACFSFYPGKNLGAFGEAGGLTTSDAGLYAHVQRLKNHGSTVRYHHDEIGYNYRMDGLQGAILSIKLKYLDAWNARRKAIAQRYQQEIKNEKITLQKQPDFADSIYHLMVATVPDRTNFMEFLQKNDIQPGLHYPVPCHLQKAYAYLNHRVGDFPHSEYLAAHCVSLPMFAELSDDEVSRVVEVINKY
jgi:dTDP-4-amino-4,6-dideoxygalactose transaminase